MLLLEPPHGVRPRGVTFAAEAVDLLPELLPVLPGEVVFGRVVLAVR